MSIYTKLRINKPEIIIKPNAKEVIFTVISCMCDNIHRIRFKKNSEGEFKVGAFQSSLTNFQMKGDYYTDLRWYSDEEDWKKVVNVINSGTSVVQSVRSR